MKFSRALLSLPFFATLLPAAAITPVSYRYSTYYPGNPDGGGYSDWETVKLTDGVADVAVWGGSEEPATEAVVGWLYVPARIIFEFGQTVNIGSVTIWAGDSDGSAGVLFPLEVTAIGANFQKSMQVANPAGSGRTAPILFSQLDFTGSTLRLDILVPEAAGWLMISEVTFSGSLEAIPEPSAFAALLGISAIGISLTRRRGRK